MLKIAIAEDDEVDAQRLSSYIKKFSSDKNIPVDISMFGNALDLQDDYKQVYDIIFLDIEMPYIGGVDAAKKIRAKDAQTLIIFVTNMVQFAV